MYKGYVGYGLIIVSLDILYASILPGVEVRKTTDSFLWGIAKVFLLLNNFTPLERSTSLERFAVFSRIQNE